MLREGQTRMAERGFFSLHVRSLDETDRRAEALCFGERGDSASKPVIGAMFSSHFLVPFGIFPFKNDYTSSLFTLLLY